MLEDDELDFDDFGELGEFEGQEMTTEELEKQLAMEFADLPAEEEIDKEESKPAEVKKDTVVATTVANTDKEEDLDEGEIKEDPNESSKSTTVKKPEALNKPLQPTPRPTRYSNNNSYNNSNNYYNNPPMMAMNMYPYPQFSNRIYVNPKFNGGQNQHQLLAQQQQRHFMELEAQRLALLQQQKQIQEQRQHNNVDLLDQKRREAAEMMKRRKEAQQHNTTQHHQTGDKRKYDDNDNNTQQVNKRQDMMKPSPAGGISIKGSAAAAALATRGINNRPYTPPHHRDNHSNIQDRIGGITQNNSRSRPSIHDRLSTSNNNSRGLGNNSQSQQELPKHKQPIISSSISTIVPIVTGGKSNTLIMKGFGDQVQELDVKKMTQGSPVKDINIDNDKNEVTVVFATIEEAVTFRRKYNRYQIGSSHINIVFKK